MTTKNVKIVVTGGAYSGTEFVGSLSEAPVTVLVPEGIVSARTSEEAEKIRRAIWLALESNDRVTIGAASWGIDARVEPAA